MIYFLHYFFFTKRITTFIVIILEMKKLGIFILLGLSVLLTVACNNKAEKETSTNEDEVAQTENLHKNLVGMINGTIYCVPSPYEIMAHVQNLNLQYNQTLPNSVLNLNLYESNFKKLLNLFSTYTIIPDIILLVSLREDCGAAASAGRITNRLRRRL